jgi:antitoxin YefM
MNAVNYSELRKKLKNYMDKVIVDHEPLIVTRKNNENIIMISTEDYDSIIESQYLLSNKGNVEHLNKSLEQLRTGKGIKKELFNL